MKRMIDYYFWIAFTIGAVIACFMFRYDPPNKEFNALSAITEALLAIAWKPR